jgi:hypothetical protein
LAFYNTEDEINFFIEALEFCYQFFNRSWCLNWRVGTAYKKSQNIGLPIGLLKINGISESHGVAYGEYLSVGMSVWASCCKRRLILEKEAVFYWEYATSSTGAKKK